MKPYSIGAYELPIVPDMAIMDSNVLVAAFMSNEGGRHAAAKAFLELWGDGGIALVPIPVLVETWGLIVGARKNRSAGVEMMKWALNPLVARLVPGWGEHVREVDCIANQFQIDIVDAWILWLASDMFTCCKLENRIRIATFDVCDFLRCAGRYPFRLYDMEVGEDLDC